MPKALLTYAIASNPSPIQTSSPQSPLNANINIGVLTPTSPIYCSEIDVAVPIGSGATSLTSQGENITGSLNSTMWNVISNEPTRRVALNIAADEFLVSFTCKDPSHYLINYNLVLGLAAQVNEDVGECTIKVYETSGTSPTNPLTLKDPVLIQVSKESPIFYLQNLVATAVGSPTVPATEFSSGTPFYLKWESNGTFFQVYQKGNPTPLWAGTQTTVEIQNGVSTDTTFFLVAMMTSNPSGDSPPSSYVPIYLYDSLTITISNPILTPASVAAAGNIAGSSLNISGLANLSGQTNIGTLNSPNGLVVNVGAEFKNTLQVDGNLWVVQGTTTLGTQTNIVNATTSGTTILNGTTTLNGPANFNALANLFGGAQICDGNPNVQPSVNPSFLLARNNSLFLGFLHPVDDAPIHFKISDGSGLVGYAGSSRTLKEDIQDFSDDFHKILKAQPVSFKFRGNEDSSRSIGYIAEDFHDLGLHHLLVYNEKNEPVVIKYDRVALYQLEIIKELLREVESLKEKVNAGLKPETEKKASGA